MTGLPSSTLVTGLIYPVATHWCWTADGWLAADGFTDFAGSAVVHLAGAMLSLPGAVILGARTSRWREGGIRGHSIPLVCLGFLILNFGFLAFNGGSQVLLPYICCNHLFLPGRYK
jgi:Amt family ammonium transporter